MFKAYMQLRNLPNTLSFIRLFLVLPFIYFFYIGQIQTAFIIFVVAAFTDALDGWIARVFKWQSRLGLIIDPLADKILIVSCFILLGYHHILPLWIVIMVFLRDIAISGGAMISMVTKRLPCPLNPSLLSKLNTVLQMFLILSNLLEAAYGNIPEYLLTGLLYTVACTTICSFFHYLWLWQVQLHKKNV
ncbi:MAG: CDP-alcohol phosphatidyltransferase family protein [Gammaproteobacteria bacterium]|nr:CDP-alcohol phosphatidyltransferase family protein [Gammaproteobacteria bacterium]